MTYFLYKILVFLEQCLFFGQPFHWKGYKSLALIHLVPNPCQLYVIFQISMEIFMSLSVSNLHKVIIIIYKLFFLTCQEVILSQTVFIRFSYLLVLAPLQTENGVGLQIKNCHAKQSSKSITRCHTIAVPHMNFIKLLN